jgi:hypothetical protein
MHKTVFAFAALLLAAGFFLRSLPMADAEPTGPVATGGTSPWRSFSGTSGTSGGTYTLMTVPAGQIFIVTTACASSTDVDLKASGAYVVRGLTRTMLCDGSVYAHGPHARGVAHSVFPSGTEVQIDTGSTNNWYVDGYLSHE